MLVRTASVVAFLLAPLHGGIISTTGNAVIIAPPASVAPGGNESNTDTLVFFERSLVFASNLTADNTATGNYPPNGSPGAVIASGTALLSYYLDFDPVGASTVIKTSSGSITFDSDILGVIFTDLRLESTHSALGSPTTTYAAATAEGLELGAADDRFSISADRRVLSFTFESGIQTSLPVHSSASLALQISTSSSMAVAIGIASRNSMTPWAGLCSYVANKVPRHGAAVLADQDPPRFRRDSQDVRISDAVQFRVSGSSNVDFGSDAPQASNNTPIEVAVSLEFDSHGVRVAVSRSVRRSSASIPHAAAAQRSGLPQDTNRSLFDSANRTPTRHALARESVPDSFPPCSQPTSHRGRDRRENRERHEYVRCDMRRRRRSHNRSALGASTIPS